MGRAHTSRFASFHHCLFAWGGIGKALSCLRSTFAQCLCWSCCLLPQFHFKVTKGSESSVSPRQASFFEAVSVKVMIVYVILNKGIHWFPSRVLPASTSIQGRAWSVEGVFGTSSAQCCWKKKVKLLLYEKTTLKQRSVFWRKIRITQKVTMSVFQQDYKRMCKYLGQTPLSNKKQAAVLQMMREIKWSFKKKEVLDGSRLTKNLIMLTFTTFSWFSLA